MKRVAVITTLKHNPGDDFIRFGLYALMKTFLKNTQIREIHKHAASTDVHECQAIIDWADTVIQAGTPCYWCSPEHHSGMSEWAGPIWQQRLFDDNKKLVLNIGAGTYFGYHSDATEAIPCYPFIDYIIDMTRRTDLTIVRDDLAKSLLTRLGFDVPLLSCPAAWAQDYVGNAAIAEKDPSLIVGSFQSIAGHYNFNNVDLNAVKFESFYHDLMASLSKHYKVIIVSHSQKDYSEAVKCLPDLEHFVVPADNPKAGLDIYARASIYVGTRIHGAYTVISNGSPAILYSSDSRSRMLDVYNMPRVFINDAVDSVQAREDVERLLVNTNREEIDSIKRDHFQIYQNYFENALDDHKV